MNSVVMQMQHNLALVKVTGAFSKSSEMMASMSKLCSLQTISVTMQEMSKEMMKAGVIEEMVADAMDDDDAELDEDADTEVEKILAGILQEGKVGSSALPARTPVRQAAAAADDDDDDLAAMQARLQQLKA
eukprot:TRINITY_DN4608_c0_g1_i2.p2 TRINITY_DN4608_c0_g1~~TRINITY_DN4608_c0_g1_i2.p2  ORF type:complete len:131 (+),score=39.21 TRINITY_DN4608_c0_g1_i2:335-727(+)